MSDRADRRGPVQGEGRTFARFFGTVLLGLAVDLAIALILVRIGVSLPLAVAIALGVATLVVYAGHELWTFRGGGAGFSPLRLAGTVSITGIVYAVRLACLWISGELLGLGHAWLPAQLLFATGVSFVVNYGLTRMVFSSRSGHSERIG